MGSVLLILSCLPSIVLGGIIYKKDRIEKEPSGLLTKLFFFGIGSIVLTLIISLFVEIFIPMLDTEADNSLLFVFVYSFISVALVEEFSKWFFLKIGTWNDKEFNHIYDAIVYAVFVSLGFATIENILYVFNSGTLMVVILRALTSVPGHVFNGVFMGYYYGLSKQASINNNPKLARKNMVLSVIVPMLMHGFFDFCLFSQNIIFIIAWLIFVICLYILAFRRVGLISKIEKNFLEEPKKALYCHNCGTHLKGEFCHQCGTKVIN